MLDIIREKIRKFRVNRYKKKKVISSITLQKKYYLVKFSVKLEDNINPQEMEREYEMLVPARAAFYARLKAKASIKKKIDLDFKKCHHMSEEELQEFNNSKQKYINKNSSND